MLERTRWWAAAVALIIAPPSAGAPEATTMTSTPSGDVLKPVEQGGLANGSLQSTALGTVTFAHSHGWYGFNVLANGRPVGLEALALILQDGKITAKWQMPSAVPPIPATACLTEGARKGSWTVVPCPPGL